MASTCAPGTPSTPSKSGRAANTACSNSPTADGISGGHSANELRAEYAGGMLQLFINGAEVGWIAVPGTPAATLLGLINEGSATADTLVRRTHFQVREGPVVALNDHFGDNSGAWPLDAGTEDIEQDGYHVRRAADARYVLDVYPGAVAPSNAFAVDAVINKVDGPDNVAFGLRFLATGAGNEAYVFLITGAGRYALLHYQGRYSRLVDFTPLAALHRGNASNELYARYADGTLVLG